MHAWIIMNVQTTPAHRTRWLCALKRRYGVVFHGRIAPALRPYSLGPWALGAVNGVAPVLPALWKSEYDTYVRASQLVPGQLDAVCTRAQPPHRALHGRRMHTMCVRGRTLNGCILFLLHVWTPGCAPLPYPLHCSLFFSSQFCMLLWLTAPFFMDIFILMCWAIWKVRNGLIFNQVQDSLEDAKKTFKTEFALLL